MGRPKAPRPGMPTWLPPAFTAPCRKPQADATTKSQRLCRSEIREISTCLGRADPSRVWQQLHACLWTRRPMRVDLNADVGESFGRYVLRARPRNHAAHDVCERRLRFSRRRSGRHARNRRTGASARRRIGALTRVFQTWPVSADGRCRSPLARSRTSSCIRLARSPVSPRRRGHQAPAREAPRRALQHGRPGSCPGATPSHERLRLSIDRLVLVGLAGSALHRGGQHAQVFDRLRGHSRIADIGPTAR